MTTALTVSTPETLRVARTRARADRHIADQETARALLLALVGTPVVQYLAAQFFVDWISTKDASSRNWYQNLLVGFDAGQIKSTINAAFIANAMGGTGGIAALIGALK